MEFDKVIRSSWVTNESVALKIAVNGQNHVSTYLSDLEMLFPGSELLHDKE